MITMVVYSKESSQSVTEEVRGSHASEIVSHKKVEMVRGYPVTDGAS